MPDYIGADARGLIVPNGDAAALAEALLRIAADAELRARLGRAAREFVENECDHRLVARECSTLYADMVAGSDNSRNPGTVADVKSGLRQMERLITSLDDWTLPELIARSQSYDEGYASGIRDGIAHAVRQNLLTRTAHRLAGLKTPR